MHRTTESKEATVYWHKLDTCVSWRTEQIILKIGQTTGAPLKIFIIYVFWAALPYGEAEVIKNLYSSLTYGGRANAEMVEKICL